VSAEIEPLRADDGRAPRRRFGRTRPVAVEDNGHGETLASLHAEVVLLREENARLKAQRHQESDIASLLGRARSVRSTAADLESVTDDTAQLLVDGLVIRESLLEICQEIERSMVAFQAKLNALALPAASDVAEAANGTGPASNGRAGRGAKNGRGPAAA
jgi:hypothetical protein